MRAIRGKSFAKTVCMKSFSFNVPLLMLRAEAALGMTRKRLKARGLLKEDGHLCCERGQPEGLSVPYLKPLFAIDIL